jgi:hypothetical protein
MTSLLFSVLSRVPSSGATKAPPGCSSYLRRRLYHAYKPKEQTLYADAVSKLSNRDLTLFQYEAPAKILKQNALALVLFPVWTQMAWFSFGLRDRSAIH